MIALALAAAIWANPDVTPVTLAKTACVPGWSSAYRKAHPPQLPTKPGMVVDHVVSIELGGNSTKDNLQYQSIKDGKAKDRDEDALHQLVCDGLIPLDTAQHLLQAWKPKNQ